MTGIHELFIHELFETQAALTPDSVALIFETEQLTYRELNRRADAVAEVLRNQGVARDSLVALFVERSLEMVVGMLGILKAGGAYVPLDPILLPAERLDYMLADSNPLVVLTQSALRARLPTHQRQVVALDELPPATASVPQPEDPVLPSDLAYVIYTSGSTGRPKGVQIEHRAVVNMLGAMQRRPGITGTDRMLALTTMSFDISVLEIFLPLACGACAIIVPSEAARDGIALRGVIERSGITIMQATPATFTMLLEAGWEGAADLKILCGGEAWHAELAGELLARCGSLWNMYGPTETTVWSAVAKVEEGRPVAVGRPIANTRFYVLDGALQLVPVGIPGELYIGGEGLARGYLNRPELTAERFVIDPFVGNGALMYRTGDLVKRLPNGTLEFLGRTDHQVKIRGHRIELGEIESALAAHPALAQAIALAYQDAHGLQNLGVYYVCNPGQSVSPRELRLFLGEKLPPYMVPSSFVAIQKFPLTASGKIDRNALRAVERSEPAPENDIREASTPVEMELVRIWREMLNVKQVGLRDNFFDLGGHSLLALRTINEINRTFGIQLNVPEFFLHPTVEQLAAALAQPGVTQIGARVVTVQKGSSGLPVYFMGARPDEYRLAQLVNRDRPVYLVDAPMPEDWISATATGNKKRLPSMEQIGALFAQALLAHVGKAPCVLVGYSLGGKIAFESAHSLHRAGGTVAFLLLIDSRAYAWSGLRKIGTVLRTGWIITKRFASGAHDGRSRARRLTSLAIKSWRLLIWQLSSFPTAVKYRLDILRHRRNSATEADQPTAAPSGYFDTNGKPIGMWIVYRMAHLVGQRWRPSPLDTAGALIRGRSDVDVLEGYDRALGWRKLFRRGFDVLQSEGNHSTILWEEHAASLSAQINALLDRYGIVNPENACAGIEVAPDSLGGERRIGQRVRSTEASDYQLASAAKGS